MVSTWVNLEVNEIKANPIRRTKTRKRRMLLLNAIKLPGKILPWKLITLREMNLDGWCLEENPFLLLAESRILRRREGINLLVHACRSNSLFFPFFFLFFYTCFLFHDSLEKILIVILLSSVSRHGKGLLL